MRPKNWKWKPELHECAVIIGYDAVYAYKTGETSLKALRGLGHVNFYQFNTIRELNAFITGVELGDAALDALAVDDLTI